MESFNWAELMDNSQEAFATLPPGTYECVIDSAEATTSSTGKLMFKIRYKVVEGPKTGSTFFNNVVLTQENPKAVYMFFQNMEAMGISREVFKSTPPPAPEMIAQMLVGNRCSVTINHRKYNGNDVENVTNIAKSAAATGVPKPSVSAPQATTTTAPPVPF